MGWPNSVHQPHQVIHNLKNRLTGEKTPHVVASLLSFGEERVFAKEQALIDLVKAELAENRPCVIYLRQTDTRDIQPRIENLIRHHVPGAKPFILKNTVDAERREKVIDAEIAKGTNVLICNPTLVQTGLDLIDFPTLIFFEITFNLSTMMQSAARSYRLNQTHKLCKVYYLFYEATMDQTAVQLMSRKQRAAKLLTGDIGLTGLDALTEGEGGFEQALMDAIGRDEALLDPSELFKANAAENEVDAEDAAYWNVELDEIEGDPLVAEYAALVVQDELQPALEDDPLIQAAIRLGGVVTEIERQPSPLKQIGEQAIPTAVVEAIKGYLDSVHVITDEAKRSALHTELFDLLPASPAGLVEWLRNNRVVFPGCEAEVADHILRLAQGTNRDPVNIIPLRPVTASAKSRKSAASKTRRLDLLAAPDDVPEPQRQHRERVDETAPMQLALF